MTEAFRFSPMLLALWFCNLATGDDTNAFKGLGDLAGGQTISVPLALSTDGPTVVGYSYNADGTRAFRWHDGKMMTLLAGGDKAAVFSTATGLSGDGETVVGNMQLPSGMRGFQWKNGILTTLNPDSEGSSSSESQGISANGRVMVGRFRHGSLEQACFWRDGLLTPLGEPASTALASAASRDGSVIVGSVAFGARTEAVRWVNGALERIGGLLPDADSSAAYAVSADGSVVVGQSESPFGVEAFRWEAGLLTGLGGLTAHHEFLSCARGVSADGRIIVGSALGLDDASQAFLWDPVLGMRAIQEILTDDLGLDLRGWVLTDALAISTDGRTVIGSGKNPQGDQEAWWARLPVSATGPPQVRPLSPPDMISEVLAPATAPGLRFDRMIGPLSHPTGHSFDRAGRMYVCETWKDVIQIFDPGATVPTKALGPDLGDTRLCRPHDVAVAEDGTAYVADTGNHRVAIINRSGSVVRKWGTHGFKNGEFNRPQSISIGPDRVYVADTGNDRIQVFDRLGKHLLTFGSSGRGDGQLNHPLAVSSDEQGTVYVADSRNHRMAVFDADGQWLRSWGSRGTSPGLFHGPGDVEVQGEHVYVVDEGNDRVQAFSKAGRLSFLWIRPVIRPHDANGCFHAPARIAFAPALDAVSLCETAEDRCQIFSLSTLPMVVSAGSAKPPGDGAFYGQRFDIKDSWAAVVEPANDEVVLLQVRTDGPQAITRIGGFGHQPGRFNGPCDIAFDSSRSRLLVSDSGNRCLKVFQEGPQITGVTTYTPNLYRLIKSRDFIALKPIVSGSGGTATTVPGAMDCDDQGSVAVIDQTHASVLILNAELEVMRSIEGKDGSAVGLKCPMDISFNRSGDKIYVTDLDRQQVIVLETNGGPPASWGQRGTGPGEFMAPWGITVDKDGFVYVSDSATHKLQKFTESGKFVSQWGSRGMGAGEFFKPMGLAHERDRIYVLDYGNQRCQVFATDGKFIEVFGSSLYQRPAQSRSK